jgi:Clp amino terminal domain, pathogenicity island component
MFERYTEKARRVIFFARYEASEFGSPYIESEFLLLGILRENKQVVTRWLGEGDWQTILREDVAKRLHKGAKTPTSVDLPLSDEAKRVLAYAAEEAGLLSHQFIGTEHLFLGLLREPRSRVAELLADRGVDAIIVRETLAKEGVHPEGSVGRRVAGEPGVPIVLVPEEVGEPLELLWRLRTPAVGEIISVDHGQGESTVYEVIKVEWGVTSNPSGHPSLSKVQIHVRRLSGSVS